MTVRTVNRLAWSLWALGLVGFAAAQVLSVLNGTQFSLAEASQSIAFFAIGTTGLVVARHQPGNALGWIFLGVWDGVAIIFGFAGTYARWATVTHPGAPGGTFAVWLGNWAWVPVFGALLTFPFLLFPDGHLPSLRWRPVAWGVVIVTTLWAIAFAFESHDFTDALNRSVSNPYTPARLVPFFDVAREVFAVAFIALMGLCVASLVVRFRRGTVEERAQVKWLILSGAVLLVFLALPADHGSGGPADVAMAFALALIPASVGIAVLKYRLYDIDVVIRKTVVYGALAVFITVIYVAIVVGVGAIVGSHSTAVLSAAAAAVVALAFQPVRRRAQRLADRVVYGKRATPYEVLSEFSDRLAGSFATVDLLPRMARILAEGTGAARADVWLRVGGELRPASTFPADATPLAPVAAAEPPSDVWPVRHQGELLGGLSIAKRAGESLTPTEEKLVADLSSQAGLVLRNVGLIEELKASRQRLVTAQDEERRKLERNIHDGAQQQLVALSVRLKLLEQLIDRDPVKAKELGASLQASTIDALEDLRDLARGIYPPLLADKGLAAALEAQARKAAVPTTVTADRVGRYQQDVEATVYFCALEALQNINKYANATGATIRLARSNGALTFEVSDDGVGFDTTSTTYGTGLQGMADRLDAVGGSLSVRSARGSGTIVTGSVPGSPREVAS